MIIRTMSNGIASARRGYGTYNDPASARFVGDIGPDGLSDESADLLQTNEVTIQCEENSHAGD